MMFERHISTIVRVCAVVVLIPGALFVVMMVAEPKERNVSTAFTGLVNVALGCWLWWKAGQLGRRSRKTTGHG